MLWKHEATFKNILPRLGTFHAIMVLLSIIGKQFADAGLWDMIIESSVIEEGFVRKVFDGRLNSSSVYVHKLM